ncbi:MAG TPA: lytic transglycosylase domain-containing protein [Streptosporangiaceae bacterium]|nr:lytic transglycosylase domain-containing protein [Streptosporangiaceae bacterium]
MSVKIPYAARAVAIAALVLGPPVALAADTTPAVWAHPAAGAAAHQRTLPGSAVPRRAVPGSAMPGSNVPRGSAPGSSVPAGPQPGSPPRDLIVPDLAAVVPAGATSAQITAISQLQGVRSVLAVAGGRVSIGGRTLSVLGVPSGFRAWAPPVTAAATGVWAALDDANMVASPAAAARLGMRLGSTYRVQGTATVPVPVTVIAPLGITGIDAIINTQVAARLGLPAAAVVLVNAPGADGTTLTREIRTILGTGASVISLIPTVHQGTLPIAAATAGRPSTWLGLYQDSAADYCPGLSWTVLAAIGEIESGDGANDGPSTAGALGPMQFMPATWTGWAIDGFGEAGTPDIMNPLDAVPSAARMLCADGATSSGGLSAAIYDYNHASWYVSEVLDLAAEYAREYP